MNEQQLQSEFEAKMKKLGYSEATLRKHENGEYYFAGVELDYQRFKDGVEMEDQKLDPVVEANRALLHERSQLGIKKYGVTLGDANLTRKELLRHALEESLDLSNYLQAELMREDMPRVEMRKVIDAEFDRFFEFNSADRSKVTSVSCKLFAEHIVELLKNNKAKNN